MKNSLKILKELRDNRYTIIKLRYKNRLYIYLLDRSQQTGFFCTDEKDTDLEKFWEKHKKSNNYCLPCELMLLFERKIVFSDQHGEMSINAGAEEKEAFQLLSKKLKKTT